MLLCLTLMIKVKEFNGDYSKCVKTKDVDKSMRKPIQTHQTISLRKKKKKKTCIFTIIQF